MCWRELLTRSTFGARRLNERVVIGKIYYLLRDLYTVKYRGSDGRTVRKGKDKAKAVEKEHVFKYWKYCESVGER